MIYDNFENIGLYSKEGSLLYKSLVFARDFDSSKADGRYEVDGEVAVAQVMSYDTRDLPFESHKDHIDIQVLLEGEELVDISLGKELKEQSPYSAQKDVYKWEAPAGFSTVLLETGQFLVLHPHDIHRPCRSVVEVKPVRKLVVKMRI